MKWIKIIWGAFCLFFFIVMCDDVYDAFNYPEKYYFGSEAMGWLYKTQESYLIFGIIFAIWFIAGFIFCLLQHKYRNLKWCIAIHLLLTAAYIFWVKYFMIYC
jgi:membrane protease YdiL (CAAX protease family)